MNMKHIAGLGVLLLLLLSTNAIADKEKDCEDEDGSWSVNSNGTGFCYKELAGDHCVLKKMEELQDTDIYGFVICNGDEVEPKGVTKPVMVNIQRADLIFVMSGDGETKTYYSVEKPTKPTPAKTQSINVNGRMGALRSGATRSTDVKGCWVANPPPNGNTALWVKPCP